MNEKSASVDNSDMFFGNEKINGTAKRLNYGSSLINNSPGRLPWYDMTGQYKEAYVIGICGGSGSGKTTVASNISQHIKVKWVTIVSLDSFYKVLSEDEHDAANRGEYDFDSPDAIDFKLAAETLKQLKKGKTVNIPIYDFTTHSRLENSHKVLYGVNVIIVEGLMTFLHPDILKLLDMKIFVETDADLRLCRRIKRDITERGRSLDSVLYQYSRYVKPNFDKYLANLVHHADIVVPWSTYNYSAVDMIGKIVKQKLELRGFYHRSELITKKHVDENLINQVRLIEQTSEVKILHTTMRDYKTEREQFCNVSCRLIRLALLESFSMIPNESPNFDEDDMYCIYYAS